MLILYIRMPSQLKPCGPTPATAPNHGENKTCDSDGNYKNSNNYLKVKTLSIWWSKAEFFQAKNILNQEPEFTFAKQVLQMQNTDQVIYLVYHREDCYLVTLHDT